MKRIFIAVRVNPEENLKKFLFSLRENLSGENIKWTDPAGIHITLAFLGATADERIKQVTQLLNEIGSSVSSFEFLLRGVGVFKSISNPRIIWIGAIEAGELVRLNKAVGEGLIKLGIPVEERAFKPHVTIGRVKEFKDQDKLRNLIEKYRNIEFQKVPVNEVILYESILGGPSAIYKPVYSAALS